MKKLISCHFNYIINKATLIILCVVMLISLLGNIFTLLALDNQNGYIENNQYYFQNNFFILKLLGTFLTIFIFSYSFLPKSDQYVYLIITRGISRVKYFLTKLVTIFLLILVIVWIEYVIYVMVGSATYPKFYFDIKSFYAFINLYLFIIFYGLLGLLLIQLFNNIYVIIIPYSLMNIGAIINEASKKNANVFYNFLFPNFQNESFLFVLGAFHIIFMIVFMIFVNLLLYYNKDLG